MFVSLKMRVFKFYFLNIYSARARIILKIYASYIFLQIRYCLTMKRGELIAPDLFFVANPTASVFPTKFTIPFLVYAVVFVKFMVYVKETIHLIQNVYSFMFSSKYSVQFRLQHENQIDIQRVSEAKQYWILLNSLTACVNYHVSTHMPLCYKYSY